MDINNTDFIIDVDNGIFKYKDNNFFIDESLKSVKKKLGKNIEEELAIQPKYGSTFIFLPYNMLYGLSVKSTLIFYYDHLTEITFNVELDKQDNEFFQSDKDDKTFDKNVKIIHEKLKQIFPDGDKYKNGDFCVKSKNGVYILSTYIVKERNKYIICFGSRLEKK